MKIKDLQFGGKWIEDIKLNGQYLYRRCINHIWITNATSHTCSNCGKAEPHTLVVTSTETTPGITFTTTANSNVNVITGDDVMTYANNNATKKAATSEITLTIKADVTMSVNLHFSKSGAVWRNGLSTYGSDSKLTFNNTIILQDDGGNKNATLERDITLNLNQGNNTLIIYYRTPSKGSGTSTQKIEIENIKAKTIDHHKCSVCGWTD